MRSLICCLNSTSGRLPLVLCVAAMLFLLTGCWGKKDSETEGESAQKEAELTLNPQYTSMPIGFSQPVRVMKGPEDVTGRTTLSLSNPDDPGLLLQNNQLLATAEGSYTLTASAEGMGEVSATIEVINGVYQGVKIVPPKEGTVTIPAGFSAKYRAEAMFQIAPNSPPTYFDVTEVASWSAEQGVKIDKGVVTPTVAVTDLGVSVYYNPNTSGFSSRTRSIDPNQATAVLNAVGVNTDKTISLQISRVHADDPFITGYKTPLKAMLNYTDTSDKQHSWDVTLDALWQSDQTGVIPNPMQGVAIPLSAGTANLTATLSSANLTSNVLEAKSQSPVLEKVLVERDGSTASFDLYLNETATLTVKGRFAGDIFKSLTDQVQWQHSKAFNLNGSTGLLTALHEKSEDITAITSTNARGSISVTASVLPDVATITISPMQATALLNSPVQFLAWDNDVNITQMVLWSLDGDDVGSVQSGGEEAGRYVSSVAGGATVTATMGDVTATATVTVQDIPSAGEADLIVTLSSDIDGNTDSLYVGDKRYLVATSNKDDQAPIDVTNAVDWFVMSGDSVMVEKGVAEGLKLGPSMIGARLGDIETGADYSITLHVLEGGDDDGSGGSAGGEWPPCQKNSKALTKSDTETDETYEINNFKPDGSGMDGDPSTITDHVSLTSSRVMNMVVNEYDRTGSTQKVSAYITDWSQYDARLIFEKPDPVLVNNAGRGFDLKNMVDNPTQFDTLIFSFMGICGDPHTGVGSLALHCDHTPPYQNGQISLVDNWGDLASGLNTGSSGNTDISDSNWKNYIGSSNIGGAIKGMFNIQDAAKDKGHKLELAFSIGGWSMSGYFSSVAAKSDLRSKFVNSVVDFSAAWNTDDEPRFHRVDLDWEYPGSGPEGSACINEDSNNCQDDANNYVTLIQDLRDALDSNTKTSHMKITLAVAANTNKMAHMVPVFEADKADDYFLMSYDFFGSGWAPELGHHSNLYPDAEGDDGDGENYSAEAAIDFMLANGVPAKKIHIGYAGYGRSASKAPLMSDKVYDKTSDALGTFENGAPELADIMYNYLNLAPDTCGDPDGMNGFKLYTDLDAKAQLLYSPATQNFMSIDTPTTVRLKGQYAKERGLGGIFCWSGDQENGILSNAAHEGLGHTVIGTPKWDMTHSYGCGTAMEGWGTNNYKAYTKDQSKELCPEHFPAQ